MDGTIHTMTGAPHIEDLWVANWPKTRGDDSLPPHVLEGFTQRGLLLDTCLRQLCLAVAPSWRSTHHASEALLAGVELRFGFDAYRYALEVATGLRSAVPGETNVHGQFRTAWQSYRREGARAAVLRITPWIHRLMNDVSAIRRDHLQGIGGGSYGTLVRRLIAPRRGEHVLLVGAGELARSILPYFDNFDVGLWNHRETGFPRASLEEIFAPESAPEAAAWADHVIFTTPPDPQHDAAWQAWLANSPVRTLVHLGHRSGELRAWSAAADIYDLDDVFALRRRQADVRSDRLNRANGACRDAARALTDAPASVPLAGLAHA